MARFPRLLPAMSVFGTDRSVHRRQQVAVAPSPHMRILSLALLLIAAVAVLRAGTPGTVTAAPSIALPYDTGISHTITCAYGCNEHKGIDSKGSTNDNYALDFDLSEYSVVRAVASGQVQWAGAYKNTSSWSCYGNSVSIAHDGTNAHLTSFYAHLSNITVKSGQTVARGDIIGYSGHTGGGSYPSVCPTAWAPHLHFAMYAGAFTPVSSPPYGGTAFKPEPFSDCLKNGSSACVDLVAGDKLTSSGTLVPRP